MKPFLIQILKSLENHLKVIQSIMFGLIHKRIFKDLKNNIKFLYILRDPIKRVYSHYNEMQSQNCAPSSLEDYILKDLINNEIVLSSCYFKQISQFLKFYSIDKFKIVTLEELKKIV